VRPALGICALAFFPLLSFAATHRLQLPARVQQGALIVGHAEPGATVNFGARALRVGSDGIFVLGIGRDASAKAEVRVRYADDSVKTATIQVLARTYAIERVNGLPPQTVNPDPEIAARIAREQAAVSNARQRDDAREDFRNGFAKPAQGRISGVYGSQRIDNGVPKSPHYGMDIAVPTGTPIRAPAPGMVSFAEPDLFLTGGTVLIDHGFGLSSSFLHMSRLDVAVGDRIERGQTIGAVGATGRASGPHLHWGFNWFDERLDPALLPIAQ
jgi:murein DD-endopeptidase MepM/ murein hydrolase activator NlpD